ncbi:hypothetical protein SAMN05192561_102346 [Halopenitus malekzadehii]|uniref:Uncharacterized protein n=1 Tax=Halopenitus malekzadehii TaxID=1267564 RepID=A0A1H6INR2_9EURY|nr:hypothetical protein [Halopenitus malekzadehii]SEH47949.1 hypothetical protein SAMN05192561_102346 [Halopenitus malekzadehii]
MTDHGSATERAIRWWTGLDRGWQAMCVSFVLVAAIVGIDLPIPW